MSLYGLKCSLTYIFLILTVCQAKNVSFITFFDCNDMTTLEDIEECDILAYVGAQLAKDIINADPNGTNYLDFHQVEIKSRSSGEVSS